MGPNTVAGARTPSQLDGVLMLRMYSYILWVIQVSCLGIIVYSLALVLENRAVLAIVLASVVLALALYLEHSQPNSEEL